jgi:type I restriction-modification system DNA methylase subunit
MGVKEAERTELHRTIWRVANDLRGSVDGWDFKTYVLGILFYRFISENLTAYLNEQEQRTGDPTFDYAALSDSDAEFGRAETVAEKGFFILPSELFANVRERGRHDENLNETLSRIFADIEGSGAGTASEHDFKGLFHDLDVNSPKLGSTVAKAEREAGQAAGRDRRPPAGRLLRQHDRRVRRRVRVPDDDVRVQCWQVRRRVLHPAGGVGAAGPDHRRRKDRGQQSL